MSNSNMKKIKSNEDLGDLKPDDQLAPPTTNDDLNNLYPVVLTSAKMLKSEEVLSQSRDPDAPQTPDADSEVTQLSQKIQHQNHRIDDLKRRIQEIKSKGPQSAQSDRQELCCLQECLQKELRTLNAYVEDLLSRQCLQPDRKQWPSIPMATTIEEDELPHLMFYPPQTNATKPRTPVEKQKVDAAETEVTKDESETPPADADPIESSRQRATVECREMMIACLQQKMQCLRQQMQKLCTDPKLQPCLPCPSLKPTARKPNAGTCCPVAAAVQIHKNVRMAGCMQKQLDQMTATLDKLQSELMSATADSDDGKPNPCGIPNAGRSSNQRHCHPHDCHVIAAAHEELCSQHTTLLAEYAQKDREVKYLREKVATLDDPCASKDADGGAVDSVDKVQLKILAKRIEELREEREECQLLAGEQLQQIADYRDKYLLAQQTVCEQRACIDTMELTKQQIEEQINEEVQRIKQRFQEKLRELAPLPKQLENERFRISSLKQENDELQQQITNMTAQLQKKRKAVRGACSETVAGGDANQQQNAELAALRKLQERTEVARVDLCAQLRLGREELTFVRTEAQRALQRMRERSELARDAMQKRVDGLEIELAETRAKAAMKLADRDEVIENMQEQLNVLSSNFGTAQTQIRMLKQRMVGLKQDCDCEGE